MTSLSHSSSADEALIEDIIKSELGKRTILLKFDRAPGKASSRLLDLAENRLKVRILAYKAGFTAPEVFTLSDFDPTPVVFSTGFLRHTRFLRSTIGQISGASTVNVVMRDSLKLIAELVLRGGHVNAAVRIYLKAAATEPTLMTSIPDFTELEWVPWTEPGIIFSLFGLAHEIGHLFAHRSKGWASSLFVLPDERMAHFLTKIADGNKWPEHVRGPIFARAARSDSTSIIKFETLREESFADMFAADLVFDTTVDLMREHGKTDFNVWLFVQELHFFWGVLAVVELCKRVAKCICAPNAPTADDLGELSLTRHALDLRLFNLRVFLDYKVTQYLYQPDEFTPDQYSAVSKSIDEVYLSIGHKHLLNLHVGAWKTFELLSSRDALHAREHQESDDELLKVFREQVSSIFGFLLVQEAKDFRALAWMSEAEGNLLDAMMREVPAEPL